jgi:hypothetical protein
MVAIDVFQAGVFHRRPQSSAIAHIYIYIYMCVCVCVCVCTLYIKLLLKPASNDDCPYNMHHWFKFWADSIIIYNIYTYIHISEFPATD